MQAFLEPLKELADYQEIVSSRRKKTGFQQIAGCVNSQKIHLAKALSDGFEYRVIVFSSEEKAKQACCHITSSCKQQSLFYRMYEYLSCIFAL